MMRLLARAPRALHACSTLRAVTKTPQMMAPCQKIQARTWFGYGMAKSQEELDGEGRVVQPIYSREPIDDSEEHLQGMDLWSAAEHDDRKALAEEVFAMAEADPQVIPDLVFYKRMFTTLIKYDDWRGVMNSRELAIESGVTEDAELKATLDTYLEEAEQRAYHEGGDW